MRGWKERTPAASSSSPCEIRTVDSTRRGTGGDLAGLVEALREAYGGSRVQERVPLADWTTFRIGGPADAVFVPESLDELRRAVAECRRHGVAFTILGGGSNTLIADAGVRGLVMRLRLKGLAESGPSEVRAEAGVTLNHLVRWTITRGLGGLESWAGTPGTVGGAVCGNAHFGGRLIAELIAHVELLAPSGDVIVVPRDEMEFGYDRSRVLETGEIVVAAVFTLSPGLPAKALRDEARHSLALRKRSQPLNVPSAGCVFQNPVPGRDPVPAGIPPSAGALIDRAGLKGSRIGGAVVSPLHAAFIVAEPGARAADVRALIERCREGVRASFGVDLREEIRYLGDFGEI